MRLLDDIFGNRSAGEIGSCPNCGTAVPTGARFCPGCGVRPDEPDSLPLHIVDRPTNMFNAAFIRPLLDDELARAQRYERPLGVLLFELKDDQKRSTEQAREGLVTMARALVSTIRDVDTPGVLNHRPARILTLLPETDLAGTAHAANRVLEAVRGRVEPAWGEVKVGMACVRPGSRLTANQVIEAALHSCSTGRPEIVG